MSAFWTNSGGTWRKAKEAWFNDAGTWRKAKKIYFNDAGTWRQVFSGVGTPALSNHTWIGFFAATIQFTNDGTLTLFDDDLGNRTVTGEWLTSSPTHVLSTDCAAYDIMFTYVSGPNPTTGTTAGGRVTKSGAAYGTWLNMASNQQIAINGITGTISGTVPGTSLVFTAAIRPAGGGATIATCTIDMSLSG